MNFQSIDFEYARTWNRQTELQAEAEKVRLVRLARHARRAEWQSRREAIGRDWLRSIFGVRLNRGAPRPLVPPRARPAAGASVGGGCQVDGAA